MARLAGLLMMLIVSSIGIATVTAVSVNFAVPMHPHSTTTTTSAATTSFNPVNGSLFAQFAIGPTQPVCYASATQGPPPPGYSSVEAVIMSSAGRSVVFPVVWVSNGCYVTGSLTTSLAPGSYTLNLSSCNWMGCKSALPKDFGISQELTTDVVVSISTGIA